MALEGEELFGSYEEVFKRDLCYVNVVAAFSNAVDARILDLLAKGPHTTAMIAASLKLAYNTASKHLGALEAAGKIKAEPLGNIKAYRLNQEGV